MLRARILSAVVLIPVVLVLMALGGIPLALLVALVIGIALDEAYALFAMAGHRPVRWAGFLSAYVVILAVHFLPTGVGIGAAAVGAVLITLTGQLIRRDRGGALTDWALTLAGALYVAWTLAHFLLLRQLSRPAFQPPFWRALGGPDLGAGAWWIFTLLILIWLCDTAAYFVGRQWGHHKMALYISPKKSWEGAAAGLVTSVGVAVGLVPLLGLPLSYPWAAVLGAIVGVVGPVGDLAESLLKRQAGVKDSGRLIPGHGGLLDRADSLMFAAPVVYYFLQCVVGG